MLCLTTMSNPLFQEYEDEDLDNSIRQTKTRSLRKSNCTMAALSQWYKETYSNKSMSPKKKRQNSTSKPLVVIMPDFESFNCSVLQDFVMIIRFVFYYCE